jgi:hypothetical protein
VESGLEGHEVIAVEGEHGHGDVPVGEPGLDAFGSAQLFQLLQRDRDAGGDGQGCRFGLFPAAGDLAVGVTDQEPDLAALPGFAAQRRAEVGLLNSQEVAGVTGQRDLAGGTSDQLAPQ